MGNYSPCRVAGDNGLHLTAVDHPNETLCGQSVTAPLPVPGDVPICPQCGKALIRHIVRQAGDDGISSIEIVIHSLH